MMSLICRTYYFEPVHHYAQLESKLIHKKKAFDLKNFSKQVYIYLSSIIFLQNSTNLEQKPLTRQRGKEQWRSYGRAKGGTAPLKGGAEIALIEKNNRPIIQYILVRDQSLFQVYHFVNFLGKNQDKGCQFHFLPRVPDTHAMPLVRKHLPVWKPISKICPSGDTVYKANYTE